MKRSNRLIILLGLILAVVVAGGVFILLQPSGPNQTGPSQAATTTKVVIATQAITPGTVIDAATMLGTKDVPSISLPAGAVTDPTSIDGFVARKDVAAGDIVTDAVFQTPNTATDQDVLRNLKTGFRAMALQVDQVTGVGTLIQPGDFVDIVLSFEANDNKFPVVIENAPTREGNPLTTVRHFTTANGLLNSTSIKVLVQYVQVLGTLLPPPSAQNGQQPQPSQNPGSTGTALNGQQEILIVALTPQQVELVRFTQLDGNLSIVLRSTKDKDKAPDGTTGMTLRILVDKYGVIAPKFILTTQP